MATALSRPLIASTLVEIAAIEQATAVAHGGTGVDRDDERLDARGARAESGAAGATRRSATGA